MLHVTYEAVTDLPPGRLAHVKEDHGSVEILLDGHAPLADVVHQFNIEIDNMVRSVRWFQLWDDEIVSCNTPSRPLRIEFILENKEHRGVVFEERKGDLKAFVDPDIDVPRFAAVMNILTAKHLSGGRWFQLYGGEIHDVSPEPMSQV
ncbi:hypothetical protein [Streptomyces sp. NPDC094149]|uniref:hypothetical protein n=1 Tax=Streptomyces sp. NPDC094149 TaxID=3155079 RepID=UPI00332400EF